MKKGIKIIIFIIASFFILITLGIIKQNLKQAGEPAAITWIGIPVIMILYFIMFNKSKVNSK